MPTLRESIQPLLVITIVSAIVMLLLAPLETTEWAAGFREGFSAEGGEGFEGDGPGGVILLIAPLIKITMLMGVPALITLGVRRLIGRFRTK